METTKMSLAEKAAETIGKLLRLTQNGEMQWKRVKPDFLTRGTEDFVDVAYVGEHNQACFIVYEIRVQSVDDYERVHWDNNVVVDLIDNNFNLLWRLPPNRAKLDLLEAVRVRTEKVEAKLDTFLADDKKS